MAAKQRQASALPASADGVIAVHRRVRWKHITVNWQLYVLAALPVAWLITFLYVPMYGNIIAFKNFIPVKGILGSPWIGFDNFTRFFRSYNFRSVMVKFRSF